VKWRAEVDAAYGQMSKFEPIDARRSYGRGPYDWSRLRNVPDTSMHF
jgi:hypothetical protein